MLSSTKYCNFPFTQRAFSVLSLNLDTILLSMVIWVLIASEIISEHSVWLITWERSESGT